MTILHTKFLVHWTGKDFHKPLTNPLDDRIRKHYVDRLADVLRNGFLMQKNIEETERIYDSDGEWIQTAVSRTCFTEIKLSMAKTHAQQYGHLGIGVTRKFVIERFGNPVFYVSNGDHANIIACARKVTNFLEKADSEILAEFQIILAYLKKMGEQNSDDLNYYDELEWRITHLTRLEEAGLVTVQDQNEHIYRIKIEKADVKVLVFPDDQTKALSLGNTDITSLIQKPICVTMDDCENF
ncbi:MAG: hypothetical protein JRE64_11865 [Deltaproteobacteria bacterium]|nr:hypothetical protein [Deltaproteobacteria bacterium]